MFKYPMLRLGFVSNKLFNVGIINALMTVIRSIGLICIGFYLFNSFLYQRVLVISLSLPFHSSVTENLITKSSKVKLSQDIMSGEIHPLNFFLLQIQIIFVFVKSIFEPETCAKESQTLGMPSYD